MNIFQRLNEKEIVGRISIGYERKIQQSSWSMNLASQIFYDIPFSAEFIDRKLSTGIIFEPRFGTRSLDDGQSTDDDMIHIERDLQDSTCYCPPFIPSD